VSKSLIPTKYNVLFFFFSPKINGSFATKKTKYDGLISCSLFAKRPFELPVNESVLG